MFSLSVGWLLFAIIAGFYVLICLAIGLSFLTAYIDDRKVILGQAPRSLLSMVPLGKPALKHYDDHNDWAGIVTVISMGLCAALFALLLWKVVLLVGLAYVAVRSARFLRRIQKGVSSLIKVAHNHTRTGKIKKAKVGKLKF